MSQEMVRQNSFSIRCYYFSVTEHWKYINQWNVILSMFLFLDIGDIPENIKSLQSLQVVDFSSNPIPR